MSVLPTGCEFLGFSPSDSIMVVLENDGTIVEDQTYFLCLPPNTKFMLLHDKETWAPSRRSKKLNLSKSGPISVFATMKCSSLCFCTHPLVTIVDGGTAWMARESVIMDVDTVDASSTAAPWRNLALQLKQDLTSIILMSEADLQVPT